MKADVQYNDFKGTAAADISDHRTLQDFLNSKKVDITKYESFGATFYSGYSDFFDASIICRDLEKSTSEKSHIVEFHFEVTKDEFFEFFKRFNVVIHEEHDKDSNKEPDESIRMYNDENTEDK